MTGGRSGRGRATSPELDQARRFLTLLDEEAPAFCFQLATDAEPKPRPDHLAKVINLPPGNLKALAVRNGNGAAVWVMINEGDGGKVRRKENVRRVRAVFADLDGSPLQPVMACELEPHIVVESSPGRFHAYWLTDGLPLDRFEGVQRRIATMFNGDHIIDLCRVMRLPGLRHQKDPTKPFMVRIVHQAERLPYSAAEILRTFPPMEDGKPKAKGTGRADLPDPIAGERLEALKAAHPRVFEHQYKSTSERDFALACLACKLGWPQEDAVALIRADRDGDTKADRPDYLWRTVASAYQKAAADDQQDLERLIEQAAIDPGAPFETGSIDFLAALRARDPAAYERARARLKAAHVRVAALDREVTRRQPGTTADGAKGKALDLPEPEPWAEPVNGAELVAGLVEQITRYVVLSDHAALASGLWVLHAHAHDVAFHSPRLTITSPTMRCGKSTLLRTIGRLVPRPLPTANITPAAMFRVIEAASPCLLIDEADSFAHENEELRGVINSSHCRLDAFVVRAVAVGDDFEARRFSTWAPMAIASIGRVASTIADRSIMIGMERKPALESVARMRADRDDGSSVLASKAARWIADHLEALRQADPEVPRALNDRQADNWRPLLAIADLAGGEWPTRARGAALALSVTDEDAETIGVQLLASVRLAFGTATQISTENLLRHLHAMTEAPWGEYGRQRKPMSPRQLATLLKPFGITSGTLREGETTYKGYRRDQFEQSWARYLSPSVTPSQPTESATFDGFSSDTPADDVTDRKEQKAKETAACDAVTDRTSVF
jgi:Protein of unknown function (DUF3631)/RepB DNA-primase from phage plasmid